MCQHKLIFLFIDYLLEVIYPILDPASLAKPVDNGDKPTSLFLAINLKFYPLILEKSKLWSLVYNTRTVILWSKVGKSWMYSNCFLNDFFDLIKFSLVLDYEDNFFHYDNF